MSFSPLAVRRMRELAPGAAHGAAAGGAAAGPAPGRLPFGARIAGPGIRLVRARPQLVPALQAGRQPGVRVDRQRARRRRPGAWSSGVDGIITDRPGVRPAAGWAVPRGCPNPMVGVGRLKVMPRPIDYPALLAGHTGADRTDQLRRGRPAGPGHAAAGRPGGLGAAGMAFVEYGPTGGRVIAATGGVGVGARPAGRPRPTRPPLGCSPGRAARPCSVDQLAGELADQLRRARPALHVGARAEIGGLVDRQPARATTPRPTTRPARSTSTRDRRTLAACAWRTCTATRPACRCTATARWWPRWPTGSPSSTATARCGSGTRPPSRSPASAAAQVLNQPLPFPLPHAGQVLDHRLPDGRWLKITSGELPGTVQSRVVTFRDITDQHRRDRRPRPVRRGDQPRAAHAGHGHQGVRRHAQRALGRRCRDRTGARRPA